jgi:hypothetical protein
MGHMLRLAIAAITQTAIVRYCEVRVPCHFSDRCFRGPGSIPCAMSAEQSSTEYLWAGLGHSHPLTRAKVISSGAESKTIPLDINTPPRHPASSRPPCIALSSYDMTPNVSYNWGRFPILPSPYSVLRTACSALRA